MKTAGLIGLGTIATHYIKGLEKCSYLQLCAVSDVDEQARARSMYKKYPFFNDYKEMLEKAKPDIVIICTPPKDHFDIARYCLEHQTDVLMEKPVTLSIEEFDKLCDVAEKNGRLFKTMFHWQNGIELRSFKNDYPTKDIREISVFVDDPYSSDSCTIDKEYHSLMGAWIDSGVNALSMIHMWLPFNDYKILHTETIRCPQSNLPLYAYAKLQIDGVIVNITIDWRNKKNHKESLITFSDKTVRICHSEQSITCGEITTSYYRMPRLDEHYYNMFTNLNDTSDISQSRSIHEVLLEVNKAL